MKKQAHSTNGQQGKKPGSGNWLRVVLVALVLGLLVSDGVLSGKWSSITLAGSEEETVVMPGELVIEDEVEEPVPAQEPEVTENAESEEKVASEIVASQPTEEPEQEEKQENAQVYENTMPTEQELAPAPAPVAEETQPAADEIEPLAEAEAVAETEAMAEAEAVTEAEAVAETEQPAVERSVTIHSNLEDTIGVNDTFEMTAELSGFEDVVYTVQWQMDEGFGWEDISGATSLVLELPASALDGQRGYRLVVNVDA